MITFVGRQITRIFGCWSTTHRGEILFRRRKRWVERRRVALVGGMDRRRNNNAGVEIDRVFGFVGGMGRAGLHLGDLGVRIGLAHPILVRELLALAPTIKTDEIVDRRRLDAALLGHSRQQLAIGFASVAAHDRPHGGVGLV